MSDTDTEDVRLIEEEDRADMDLSGLDTQAVEEEAAPEEPTPGDDGDDPDDPGPTTPGSPDDSEDADAEDEPEDAGKWGELYCSLCCTVTNEAIREFGGPDAETVDRSHFSDGPVPLDRYFNETLEKMMGSSDMPPEQALVVGTAIAVGGPIAQETDLIGEMIRGDSDPTPAEPTPEEDETDA